MPIPQNFEKAKLMFGGETIEVLFNPKEYSIQKANTWKSATIRGAGVANAEFNGGNPRQMTLNGLLLDKSLYGPGASVRENCEKLFKMMEPKVGNASNSPANSPRAAPPLVTFAWGANVSFKAVCDSLTVAYKLFQPNGEPVRAEVNMTLREAKAVTVPAQNPTTRAEAGLGVHTMQEGESLQAVAYRVYGEASRWRTIAEVNGIDNPLHVRRGTRLMLPRIEG